MLLNLLKFNKSSKELKINQSNVFYNYTLGFESSNIDLLKTAGKLLKTGIAKSVFFSDFKCVYLDNLGNTQVEFLKLEGRQWDSSWGLEFNQKMPESVAADAIGFFEVLFHENRISLNNDLYLRASLPPLVLEDEDNEISLFSSVKIYKSGIAILSFQFDATWQGIDENEFIARVVNIFQIYFKSIWVDSKIQTLDADVVLINAFEDTFSVAGEYIKNKEVKKTIKEMKKDSQRVINDAFQIDGKKFHLGGDDWSLHEIAGSKNDDSWESTLDLCRSIYSNAVSNILVFGQRSKNNDFRKYMWEGRPSICLLRFDNQPQNKNDLIKQFSSSMSKILLRANFRGQTPDLPIDLRMFDDYCLHAQRSALLWTWLRSDGDSDNVWDEPHTRGKIFENQARAEQIEYYNMRIARACSWAHDPLSDIHLFHAYETLVNSERLTHHSSQAGEVSAALSYIINEFGTASLIPSAKEAARYHLEELRYKSDSIRNRRDRGLTFVFGLVGAATLAEFVVHPFIQEIWPKLSKVITPILSFGISGALILSVVIVVLIINKDE